jgi:hypothetical protein
MRCLLLESRARIPPETRVGGVKRPQRPAVRGGPHPKDRNEVEDALLRVAARRGGPRRESRPPWFLGECPKTTSARASALSVPLAQGIVTEGRDRRRSP